MNQYLKGEKVYGDDFTLDQIKEWYKDEEKGYYNLYNSNNGKEKVNYDNKIHSFYAYDKLCCRKFNNAMGLGSADGREFLPIIHNINQLSIVEIAEEFYKESIEGTPTKYIKPDVSGKLPYADDSFDLIMASSVLHHIPNIKYVWSELDRCLMSGGVLIVQEPIVYMGGMEGQREGLTLRERGIPMIFFSERLLQYNVVVKAYFDHGISRKIIGPLINKSLMDSNGLLKVDQWLCRKMALKSKYFTNNVMQKLFQAASVYLVLEKK